MASLTHQAVLSARGVARCGIRRLIRGAAAPARQGFGARRTFTAGVSAQLGPLER